MFKLDKRLESDTILVKELESFQVRLMNARQFFWIVLIPNKPNLTELSDLNINERNYLMNFAIDLGKFIKSAAKYDKVNFGMLGNVVSQLHLHIVLRKKNDAAWPGPVWGAVDFNKYKSDEVDIIINLSRNFSKTLRA